MHNDLDVVARYTSEVPAFEGVGLALARLREEKGMTQEEVSQSMGTGHRSNASKIENGKDTKSSSISRYLDAIGATAFDLARALAGAVSSRTLKSSEHAARDPRVRVTQAMVRRDFPKASDELVRRYVKTLDAWKLLEEDVAKLKEELEESDQASTAGGPEDV